MQEHRRCKVCPDLCFGEEIAFLASSRDQTRQQEPGWPQSTKGNESQGRSINFGDIGLAFENYHYKCLELNPRNRREVKDIKSIFRMGLCISSAIMYIT
ncbi:hypothetical protein DV515_00009555 [Chloebia gouldiae]|uniref:Uncharacterized protein n=1 Tax=Chloebia gouldiae TaxID=44316 RepID=A0A3L8SBG2_CHLGU|nr:hypothetical protein DV515_00009555 [Chloebia gouldiae]